MEYDAASSDVRWSKQEIKNYRCTACEVSGREKLPKDERPTCWLCGSSEFVVYYATPMSSLLGWLRRSE